jgi:hypothetical protein
LISSDHMGSPEKTGCLFLFPDFVPPKADRCQSFSGQMGGCQLFRIGI